MPPTDEYSMGAFADILGRIPVRLLGSLASDRAACGH